MDQHQTPQHFSKRHSSLLTVGDARMGHSLGMEPEEVRVVRYQNTSGGGSKGKLRSILSADQTRLDRSRNVDPATT